MSEQDEKDAMASAPDIQEAITYHRDGEYTSAKKIYEQLLEEDEDNVDALNNLGHVLIQQDSPEEGLEYLGKAYQIRKDPLTLVNIARGHFKAGRGAEAEKVYQAAIEMDPGTDAAHRELGGLYHKAGCYEKALEHFEHVAQINTDNPQTLQLIVQICREMDKPEKAARYARDILRLEPDNALALAELGYAEWQQGRQNQGMARFVRAMMKESEHSNTYFLPARIMRKGDPEAARDLLYRAIDLAPEAPEALRQLCEIEHYFHNYKGLENAAYKYLELSPDDSNTRWMLIHALDKQLKPDKANDQARELEAGDMVPEFVSTFSNACAKVADYETLTKFGSLFDLMKQCHKDRLAHQLGLNSVRGQTRGADDVRKYIELEKRWARHVADKAKKAPITRKKDGKRQDIRIGFFGLSSIPALRALIAPVMARLDTDQFTRVLAFSSQPGNTLTQGQRTDIASNCDEFYEFTEENDRDLAAQLGTLDLDIIVGLNGLQQPGTRAGALAWRPASIQMTWAGTPSSCPMAALDYQILDPDITPEDKEWETDTALQLGESWACFGTMPDFELAGGLPSTTNGYVTFGVNGQPDKFNDVTIANWARVLQEMPDARLLFLNPGYANERVRENLRAWFDHHGVGDRIGFNGEKAPQRKHMLNYNEVDVLLDNHPMCGGIGLLEALHMGVPAVTLKGGVIQHRLGHSQLTSVGLADCSQPDWDGYVQKAVELAGDETRRKQLRTSLRESLSATSFIDMDKFVGEFQDKMLEAVKGA